MYILILAGGVGSRMWPRSRQAIPKQFLDITGGETMIQIAVRRIAPLVSPENVFIATGERYVDLAKKQLPMLPAENIIAEISGKNTAPAIALGALHIAQKDPSATMAVLTADHLIPDEDTFRLVLQAAADEAQNGNLVTLGITPTGAETGYGYIQRDEILGEQRGQPVYRVKQFLEKPDTVTAQKFFDSGEYYWNSGMFIWQVRSFFSQLEKYMPQLASQLDNLKAALFGDSASAEKTAEAWQAITPQSIDVGLMEKAENVAVVPLDAGWNDVGSWAALFEELADSPTDNAIVNAEHLTVDSAGLLVQGGGKLVATIGVENLIIIETDDALLVCAKDRAQDVKKIVEKLKSDNRLNYL